MTKLMFRFILQSIAEFAPRESDRINKKRPLCLRLASQSVWAMLTAAGAEQAAIVGKGTHPLDTIVVPEVVVDLQSAQTPAHELVGEGVVDGLYLADAILDRIVHSAYRINLKGESTRKEKSKLTEKK